MKIISNSGYLRPDDKIRIEGFESIESRYNGYFDVVSSNIPFGDYTVFDSSFYKGGDKDRSKATRTLHNYFFFKGTDCLRPGGILAYLTSQGLMNSPSNEYARAWLMQRCDLVSAIRLPSNLFTDEAGTEVASDLIILQKNPDKKELAEREHQFISTRKLSNGIQVNSYHKDLSKVIHTKIQLDTDPYGHPALIATHEGGVPGIAADLKDKLKEDLSLYLDVGKYQSLSENREVHDKAPQKTIPLASPAPLTVQSASVQDRPKAEPMQGNLFADDPPEPVPKIPDNAAQVISLYELFGITAAEAARGKPQKNIRKNPTIRRPAPTTKAEEISPDLFSNPGTSENVFFQTPDTTNGTPHQPQTPLQPLTNDPREFTGTRFPFHKEGSLVTDQSQVGYLRGIHKDGATFHPLELSASDKAKAKDYIALRDAYGQLYYFEADNREENPALRKNLNFYYHQFVRRNGNLTRRKNLSFAKMDIAGREILSLERIENGIIRKADIFDHPVSFSNEEILHAETASEALAACLNKYGEIDFEYMEELTGKDIELLKKDLAGRIYFNPLEKTYQIAERFICGDVIDKADQIEQYLREHPEDTLSQDSLKALRLATPEPVSFEELDINLGERWIQPSIYSEYATHLFKTDVSIRLSVKLDNFSVYAKDKTVQITDTYSVSGQGRTFDGVALMKHALVNTIPQITKKGYTPEGNDVNVPDPEAIQNANTKIDLMRNGFSDWLNDQSQEFKDRLADRYNRLYNCSVRPQYDGSHLKFPDLDRKASGITDLYKTQKDAVWMLIMNGGGTIDHEVGGGKTLIMCCAAHEMKRMKLTHKPLLIGLKANIGTIAADFRNAYPNDRILAPEEKDFTPKNRTKLFIEMMINDWDAVILTHEQFAKIPQSPEVCQRILQDELDTVEENLNFLKSQGKDISRGQLKGLIARKMNLEAKLRETEDKIRLRTDDTVDFRMMGFDHIFVDESHRFKNLMFNTRHDRVAGLGNPEGSQRAANMLFAIRTIQERTGKDLGATFLSGTVISNSLTELFTHFKYLRPNALARQGIYCIDAWLANYARKSIDFEFNVTNQIVRKERFREFIKVPELAAFYNQTTDYKTAADIGLQRPVMNEILYNIPQTQDQKEYAERLMKFATDGDPKILGIPFMSEEMKKAKMLIATNYARKAALDMRLIDREKYGDDPGNKASHCAAEIYKYYKKYDPYKGTSFVFSDLGTYKPDQWNPSSEVKRKLVEDYHIPENEIRFIQQAGNQKQRKGLIDGMNKGTIRVLFGSTETLGTGVNAQARAISVHHLDAPWRPSDLDQRTGRAVRKGNWVAEKYAGNKVDVIYYAVDQSLDAYKFNLLKNKQLFIMQLKKGALGKRKIDEGSDDPENGMNYAEYMAILSGNTDLLEKSKLTTKITALESERHGWGRNKSHTRFKLEHHIGKIEEKNKTLACLSADWELFNKELPANNEGKRANILKLDGLEETTDLLRLGKYLNELAKNTDTFGGFKKIGTLKSFDLLVKTLTSKTDELELKQNHFFIEGPGGIKHTYNNGTMATTSELAGMYFLNALDKIPGMIDRYRKEINGFEKDIPALKEVLESRWPREDELKKLKTELDSLERRIQVTLDKEKEKEGQIITDQPPKKVERENLPKQKQSHSL